MATGGPVLCAKSSSGPPARGHARRGPMPSGRVRIVSRRAQRVVRRVRKIRDEVGPTTKLVATRGSETHARKRETKMTREIGLGHGGMR